MRDDYGAITIRLPEGAHALEQQQTRATFADWVSAFGLDRETDFQHSDLSGVDFSNADLRGFNFSGSDLTGSFGVNVRVDDSTNFDRADVGLSPFSFTVFERRVRREARGFDKDYERLRSAYWADQMPEVVKRLHDEAGSEKARLMAMRLFTDAKQGIVRADMLRVLGVSGLDREEYCAFLLHACATQTERSVLVAAVRILSSLFRDREVVFETFVALLTSPDEAVRLVAMEGISRSKHFSERIEHICRMIWDETSPRVRRAFLLGAARSFRTNGRLIAQCDPVIDRLANWYSGFDDKWWDHSVRLPLKAGISMRAFRNEVIDFVEWLTGMGFRTLPKSPVEDLHRSSDVGPEGWIGRKLP